jgi:hypothetical protein
MRTQTVKTTIAYNDFVQVFVARVVEWSHSFNRSLHILLAWGA